jgi:hypothetical protein
VQKLLSWILVILFSAGVSSRTAYGYSDRGNKRIANLKAQFDNLPAGTQLKVKLKDHREIDGELVARSDESFELRAPEPVNVSYSEVKSIAGADAQVSSGGTPTQQSTHHHRVLKYVIIFAIAAGLTIALAAAAK